MDAHRRSATISLLAAFLWQLYAIGFAWANASKLQELYQGLGLSLPFYSQAFFATYRYWPLMPLLAFVLAFDVLRRTTINATYYALTLTFTLSSAMLMSIWSNEACFRPFLHVSKTLR